MPIYEYSCRSCHHSFEEIVLSANDEIHCPRCATTAVERQLSVFSSPGSRGEENPSNGGGCGGCGPHGCGCH